MYDFKEIFEAHSIAHAVQLLAEHPQAKVLAGGSDILVQTREGKLAGIECVSIYTLEELRGITMDDQGNLRIAPLTCFTDIEESDLLQKHVPVLCDAVATIGGPQIRNIGTIGGNICNGVTSADSASTLLALDAMLEITNQSGTRTLPITEFYLGAGKVALQAGDLLTCIVIPPQSYQNTHGAYIKYSMRDAMDIATINVSLNVCLAQDRAVIDRLRIAFGVAAPVPIRCPQAEAAMKGAPLTHEAANKLAQYILQEIKPRSSWRASKELRLQVSQEMTKRAFEAAVQRAGGSLS